MSTNEGKTVLLTHDRIKKNPLNTYPAKNIDDMVTTLRTYGLIEPLAVIGPDEEECYILISGERRLEALKKLNEEESTEDEERKWPVNIPCHVIGLADMPEDDQKLLIEIANLESREMNEDRTKHMANVMRLLKRKVESGALSERKIAMKASEYFKTSTRYARYWRLVFMDEKEHADKIQKLAEDGQVKIREAAQITKMDNPEDRMEVIEQIEEGMPAQEVIDKKKAEIKKKGKINIKKEDLDNLSVPLEELDAMKGSDMSGATAANSNVENAVKASDSVQPEGVESWEADYEDNYEDNLQMIIDWCEKIKTVEDPTDEEWEAIKACEEVAEHFS